jgi:iron complex outermembrane recepter protein
MRHSMRIPIWLRHPLLSNELLIPNLLLSFSLLAQATQHSRHQYQQGKQTKQNSCRRPTPNQAHLMQSDGLKKLIQNKKRFTNATKLRQEALRMQNSPLTKQVFFSLLLANSIFGQAANKPTTPDSKLLDELVVKTKEEQTKIYESKNFGGTRLDVPLLEVPQSIRVITKQQLKDITAVRMKDTFDYVSGVSQQNDFGGGLWENYAVRGFTGDSNNAGLAYLLNGFQSNRGFNAPRDTANVESIEFLKGPSAALFGGSDPGGTINVVTKKPLWESYNSVQSLVGSYNFMRHTLDSTGPLSDSFAYRFNYAYEDANSFRDFVGNNRSFYSLATTWKINESTTLDYSGEYLDALSDFDRGVFAINNVLGLVPRDRFFGEPNDAPMENQNHTSQLRLTHELNEDWFIRLGTAYKTNSLYGFSSETRDVNAALGTMRRRYRLRDYDSDDLTLQAEISGKITNGNLEHNILAGADSYWFETDQRLLSGNYAILPRIKICDLGKTGS